MGRASWLLVLLLAACSPPVGAEPPSETLLPEKPQSRDLRPGETHRYSLNLAADEYIWTQAIQQSIDFRLTLRGPDGEKLESVDDQTPGGLENLYWITDQAGLYSLEVAAVGGAEAAGRYQLTWEWHRPATEELRQRTPSDRAYTRAFGLQNKSGRERWEEAIALYTPTLSVWQKVGDRAQEASTLDNIGTCHLRLEEFSAAASYFQQAVEVWPEPDFSPNKANSLHNLAGAQTALEKPLEAVATYQAALEILRGLGKEVEAARTLLGLGSAYKDAGQLSNAERVLLEALASFEQRSAGYDLLLTLNTLGTVYTQQGRVDEALAVLDRARGIVDEKNRLGARVGAAVAANLGVIYSWIGEPTLALAGFERALEINRRVEDRTGEAEVERQLGLLNRDLAEYDVALTHLERSVELKAALGKIVGTAEAQVLVGDVNRLAGRPDEALKLFAKALPVLEARGKAVDFAMALEKQGLALEAAGRSDDATAAYRRALSTLGDLQEAGREARLYSAFGARELRAGAVKTAESWLRRALERARSCADRATEAKVLIDLARLARRRGELEPAQKLADEALEVVEAVRSHVGGEYFRASYLAQQLDAFALAVDLLAERHRREPARGFDAAAFELSERMRARVLFEQVASSQIDLRAGVDPELLAREHALRRQINARESFRQTTAWRLSVEDRAGVDREIGELLHTFHAVEALIDRQSPSFAALSGHRTLTLEEVKSEVLDVDTALLEVLLGEERSFLWVVTRNDRRLVELPPRAELEGLARRLRELLTAPAPRASQSIEERQTQAARVVQSERGYVAEGRRLSALLLEPAAGLIGDRRLVFVVDGALNLLPFAVLPTLASTPDAWEPLIAEREVVQAPSASVVAALRREKREAPDRLLAVFADPVFERTDVRLAGKALTKGGAAATRSEDDERAGLSRLENSRLEAEALVGLAKGKGEVLKALDFDASRTTALGAELGHYRFLHFATHGIVDDQHPELSGIALSAVDATGQPIEGFLHLHEVYGLRLRAELAVLSACETAVGREVRGEGLLSLTRGFMHAGVPRVVASLWRVNDRTTAELMERFYEGLLTDGLRPAAALRQAMLAVWRGEEAERARHPYYWAGFGLWGDWR